MKEIGGRVAANSGQNRLHRAHLLVVILVTHSELEHSLHEEAQRTYIAGVAAGVFFLLVGAIAGAASLVVIALSREN